jgi:hypothetical protein
MSFDIFLQHLRNGEGAPIPREMFDDIVASIEAS